MKISNETIAVLEDIENRLDPETEDDFLKQWDKTWRFHKRKKKYPNIVWKSSSLFPLLSMYIHYMYINMAYDTDHRTGNYWAR